MTADPGYEKPCRVAQQLDVQLEELRRHVQEHHMELRVELAAMRLDLQSQLNSIVRAQLLLLLKAGGITLLTILAASLAWLFQHIKIGGK